MRSRACCARSRERDRFPASAGGGGVNEPSMTTADLLDCAAWPDKATKSAPARFGGRCSTTANESDNVTER